MRKLLSMFKGLPPEVRMMIAMAGLGTPIGAIYAIKRWMFPNWPHILVILLVGGVIAGICLIGFLISKIFGRGAKKRQKKMAGELAADGTAGPVAMDVRAAIKSNNEKFFTAIRDMRKNIGLSVYDLPWYIVLGDSGCGKTKLVNEGGLTFSTGKPEGYQLGTLNYNWWFTEDAIFIDMAGRLCNPQDDADRREWESFLSTIGKGRKGFPINGALVCVSADHLLQDSPEKIEQDANTTLERLRDLQSKLGVTFATYLIVTKCDKILGFMQFFDRAERDITFKNQIFGWSKPGNFTELYDPELFGVDFEGMYGRLNELRLRRLHDEADEIDLGLAYSFPEEYRELLAPLQTYVRTLFPMIRHPRAIKNLIFRGIYFTSATQEGALILKHLTERLGADVAGQFAPLDLYPNKRPHFIKDLLLRKVLPEHGLVFRNEQQVVRNRKIAKLLKWGSVVLFVLLFGTLALSSVKFGAVIAEPREAVADAQPAPQREWTPADALKKAGVLGANVNTLKAHRGWARILSLGVGADRPINDLGIVRAGLFEEVLLREALAEVGKALRTVALVGPRGGPSARQTADEFMAALEQYVAWFGCSGQESPAEHMSLDNFQALCAVVTNKETAMVAHREQFFSQAADYFTALQEGEDWDNPARILGEEGMDPAGTISTALRTVHRYLAGYARLDDTHPDPVVREWMRVHAACLAIEKSYSDMLGAVDQRPRTLQELDAFRDGFVGNYQTFAQAVEACTWRGERSGLHVTIDPLLPAISGLRESWTGYQDRLVQAYSACDSPPDQALGRTLAALSTGSNEARLPGLDRTLWEALQSAKLAERGYNEANFEAFAEVVQEVPALYAQTIRLKPGEGTTDDALLTSDELAVVGGVLKDIHDRLVDLKLGPADDPGTPGEWVDQMEDYLDPERERPSLSLDPLPPVWRGEDLVNLHDAHMDLVERGGGQQLLETIYTQLGQTGDWGFAELVPDWHSKKPSVYQIGIPRAAEEPEAKRDGAKKDRPPKRRERRRGGRRSRGRRPSEPSKGQTVRIEGDRFIPACAKRDFLSDRAYECASLLYNLADFGPDFFFAGDQSARPLNERCIRRVDKVGRDYMETYVRAWAQAYDKKHLRELERLSDQARDWESLARMMKRRSGGRNAGGSEVADELQVALAEILEALPFWNWWFDEEANEWTDEVDTEFGEWNDVASWMQEAIEGNWLRDSGIFAVDARLPRGELDDPRADDPPWVALSNEFVGRWNVLARSIALYDRLPTKFETDTPLRDQPTIPWNTIGSLRQEARIDDERLTGELVAFEDKAKQLLSQALTEALCSVQSRYMPEADPFDGWPYLNRDGDGAKALETVNFDDFKRFVREVKRAGAEFASFELALPQDGPLWVARSQFYRSCREWMQFMQLNQELVPGDLSIVVRGADPMTPPFGKDRVDDTAQFYYDAVALDLGLCVKTDESAACNTEQPLRIPTLVEQKIGPRNVSWNWTNRPGNRELTVALVEGVTREGASKRYPTLTRVLGESSQLAFCAYLHRYGVGSGEQWVSSHSFHLIPEFKRVGVGDLGGTVDSQKPVVGEKFVFRLAKPLPRPIRKLQQPPRR